jgi:hypothetical protein
MLTEPHQETPPVETAQNTPPPALPPSQGEEQAPEKLPATASLYPLVGFSGLFSLGVYGLLRLKRPA